MMLALARLPAKGQEDVPPRVTPRQVANYKSALPFDLTFGSEAENGAPYGLKGEVRDGIQLGLGFRAHSHFTRPPEPAGLLRLAHPA
jgi:hypothetical protein